MKLSELVNEDQILINCPEINKVNLTKEAFLKQLVKRLSDSQGFTAAEQDSAFEHILAREKSMSTGIGDGVAIPHAMLSFLDKPTAILCLNTKGIEFDSIDRRKVHIVILLLAPKGGQGLQNHIFILANISKLFYPEENRNEILSFSEPSQVYDYIKKMEN